MPTFLVKILAGIKYLSNISNNKEVWHYSGLSSSAMHTTQNHNKQTKQQVKLQLIEMSAVFPPLPVLSILPPFLFSRNKNVIVTKLYKLNGLKYQLHSLTIHVASTISKTYLKRG